MVTLRKEFDLLKYIHGQGLPVNEALHIDTVQQLLVLSYLPGAIQFNWNHQEISQAANLLSRIHQLSYQDLPSLESRTDLLTDSALNAWKLEPLLQRLEVRQPINNNPPTLLHGDFWPGNLLSNEHGISSIIDWEDAHFGDPLVDLATMRIELGWIQNWQAAETFTSIYLEQFPLNTMDLFYWDCHILDRILLMLSNSMDDVPAFFRQHDRPDLTANKITSNMNSLLRAVSNQP